MSAVDIGDDDIFFQELDAAYCAIFEPEGVNPEVESIVRNKSHQSIAYQTHDHTSAFCHNQDPSPVGSIDTLFCDQLDLDVSPTFANPSNQPQEELTAFSHSNSMRLKLPELSSTGEAMIRGPELQLKSHSINRLPSRTAPDTCSPIPPGFWTQKRLY
jgi:hypothetical protein